MIALMLPFFFLAMFERDGQPAEKLLRKLFVEKFGSDTALAIYESLIASGVTKQIIPSHANRILKTPNARYAAEATQR